MLKPSIDDRRRNASVSFSNRKSSMSVAIVNQRRTISTFIDHQIRNMSISTNAELRRMSIPGTKETKLYEKRWWILILFAMYTATSAFQWINYAVISTVITKFYGVSSSAADWLSMVYMLVYIPLIFPVTWMLDRYGLRIIAIIGSSLNALGAIVKTTSNKPHLFSVCMLGSTISAIGQVFITGMPPMVAATWFGRDEVSTACSVGVLGYLFGIALGFLIPSNVVPADTADNSLIEHSLNVLTICTAVVATILAVMVFFTFDRKPKLPPCAAQAQLADCDETEYLDSLKKLMYNRSSLLLIISFGINVGAFNAISTLLNDEILHYHPARQQDAGKIGLTMVLCGILGTIVCGVILDKTRAYRKTTIIIYILGFISFLVFSAALQISDLWLVYRVAGGIGFTMNGYLPVGLEYATEITYPINEGVSSGLMTLSTQIFGIVLIISMRKLMAQVSILAANLLLSALIGFGCILTIMTKEDLKRQRANDEGELNILTQQQHHQNSVSEQNENSLSEPKETRNSEPNENILSEPNEDSQSERNENSRSEDNSMEENLNSAWSYNNH